RWPRDWSSDVCSSDLGTLRVDCRCQRLFVEMLALLDRAQSDFLILNLPPQPIDVGGVAGGYRGLVMTHGVIETPFRFQASGAIRSEERRVGKEGGFRW